MSVSSPAKTLNACRDLDKPDTSLLSSAALAMALPRDYISTMQWDRAFENSMAMSDRTWKRHANPWSVWTRLPILPLFALAIWSRIWIGPWCLLPIAILVAWAFYNPRAFSVPASTDNWASKCTFGERVWLNRKKIAIPEHHRKWALGLAVASGVAMIPMVWGLYTLDPWAAFLGTVLAVVFKLWFLDRMVWLYDDMSKANDEYRSWLF